MREEISILKGGWFIGFSNRFGSAIVTGKDGNVGEKYVTRRDWWRLPPVVANYRAAGMVAGAGSVEAGAAGALAAGFTKGLVVGAGIVVPMSWRRSISL